MILATCPRCGHDEEDFDGFGVLACDECGYCSHPDSYGGVCNICGVVTGESRPRRAALLDGTKEPG